MEKIRTVIFKEWSEVFKNRLVFFSVAFLPLMFIALPVITMLAAGDMGASGGEMDEAFPGAEAMCVGLTAAECGEVYFINLYAFMFMILPVAIPVTIAAYSIVGEKTTRSLEPLLATPITTVELLAGKALAAIIPAVAATWISFGIFAAIMCCVRFPHGSSMVPGNLCRRPSDDVARGQYCHDDFFEGVGSASGGTDIHADYLTDYCGRDRTVCRVYFNRPGVCVGSGPGFAGAGRDSGLFGSPGVSTGVNSDSLEIVNGAHWARLSLPSLRIFSRKL